MEKILSGDELLKIKEKINKNKIGVKELEDYFIEFEIPAIDKHQPLVLKILNVERDIGLVTKDFIPC